MKNPIALRLATPDDAQEIEAMARRIWPTVYREMISAAQIEHMLDLMYAPATLRREISFEGIRYFWVLLEGTKIGFLSTGPARENTLLLHKAYLLPEFHGRNLGTRAMERLFELLRECGTTGIELRVNRNNAAAIAFYRKNGFVIAREDCADIGEGFVMDDFIMTKNMADT